MGEPDPSDVCFPITDLSVLFSWKCNGKCWIDKHYVEDLKERSTFSNLGGVLDLRGKDKVFPEFKLPQSLLPKTIFCHDFKGGYLEDRFCNGSPNIDTYRFFNWAAVDIFIYFSHKLVTIPPQGWLNTGHLHGVPVLGTLITEWSEGEEVWRRVLTDVEKTNLFSLKLAEICAHFKFDGYLLNVENPIPEDFVPRLLQFVRLLKGHLELLCGRRTWLIWYDSVTMEGSLLWQNKLCPLNKPFFDVCDGIFINYVWQPTDLLQSLELAGSRRFDVFVGLDVWGRNCYQDGGFNVEKALAVIRSLNMSVALFAPGWTFETLPPGEMFLPREIMFWKKLWRYLYTHGPVSLPFQTDFCQGITFDKDSGKPLFNLGKQQHQPTGLECSPANSCVSPWFSDGLSYNGACLMVTATSPAHASIFHRVFVCGFAGAEDKVSTLLVTLALKNSELNPASKFRIYFVTEDKLSVEGKQSVSMREYPRGYRAGTRVGGLVVSGSVMDFTKQEPVAQHRITVLHTERRIDSWHHVQLLVELGAAVSLTEVLLLPPPQGSVLWGLLRIERSSIPVNALQPADF